MSVRFSSVDVAAIGCCLTTKLVGKKVHNIYNALDMSETTKQDANKKNAGQRVWIFRFQDKGTVHEIGSDNNTTAILESVKATPEHRHTKQQTKLELVIEPGIRIHTTRLQREKESAPSNFTGTITFYDKMG